LAYHPHLLRLLRPSPLHLGLSEAPSSLSQGLRSPYLIFPFSSKPSAGWLACDHSRSVNAYSQRADRRGDAMLYHERKR
jgi:hypothetical protein